MKRSWVSFASTCMMVLAAACGDGAGGGEDKALELSPVGAVADVCGPADGAALSFEVGSTADCSTAPGAEPQAWFYIYSGSTASLAAGQSWQLTGSAGTVQWFPQGAGGNYDTLSGSLEILTVSGSEAKVRYAFVTADDARYAGEATVSICQTSLVCP